MKLFGKGITLKEHIFEFWTYCRVTAWVYILNFLLVGLMVDVLKFKGLISGIVATGITAILRYGSLKYSKFKELTH